MAVNVDFATVFQSAYSKLSPEAKSVLEGKTPGSSNTTESEIDRKVEETRRKIESSTQKIKQDQKGFVDKSKEGYYGGGSQAGTQVEQDLNELKSGRFAGVFERAFNSVKSMKDTYQEIFGQKKEQAQAISKQFQDIQEPKVPEELTKDIPKIPQILPPSFPSSGMEREINPISGGEEQPRERFAMLKAINEETRNKIKSSRAETENYFQDKLFGEGETALATVRSGGSILNPSSNTGIASSAKLSLNVDKAEFDKAEFKKTEMKQGGIPGMGGIGGGGQRENASGSMAEGAGKFGLVVGGIAAAGLKLMSSLAGMYQQAMQQQDSTLDAMGYVGSGGALTSNAEMAQIGLRRAKLLGGEGKDQLGNKLGVQFGLRQGIGGTEGAETFAKLNKFASFKEDKESFKQILAQGIKGGFEGLRQSEMFSRIASMSESSYLSGYGKSNALDTAGIIAELSKKGIGSDNALSMTENLQKQFQESGSTFQNMVISAKLAELDQTNPEMDDAEKYMRAKASAEDAGNLKQNIGLVSNFLKTSTGASDSEIGVMLNQMGVATAKQLVDSKDTKRKKIDPKTGKEIGEQDGAFNVLDMAGEDFRASASDYKKATAEFSKTVKVGQSYRATANAIDNLVVGSAVAQTAYMTQLKITSGMIDFLGEGDKRVSSAASQIMQGDIKNGLGTLVGGEQIGSKEYQDKLKKTANEQGSIEAIKSYYKDLFGIGKPDQNNFKSKAESIVKESSQLNQGKLDDKSLDKLAGLLKDLNENQALQVELSAKQLGINEAQLKEAKQKAKGLLRK